MPNYKYQAESFFVKMAAKIERGELYFCLHLTENEHYIVEDEIRGFCDNLNLTMHYYRKLKDGHIPMYRECKITGDTQNLWKLMGKLQEDLIDENMEPNPHKQICFNCQKPAESTLHFIDDDYCCDWCWHVSRRLHDN